MIDWLFCRISSTFHILFTHRIYHKQKSHRKCIISVEQTLRISQDRLHWHDSMFDWNCSKLWFWADSSRDRTNELDIYTKIFIDGTNLFPEKSYRSQKIEFEVSIRIFYLYGLYKTQRNYILQERMNRLNSGNPLSSICVGFMTVLSLGNLTYAWT